MNAFQENKKNLSTHVVWIFTDVARGYLCGISSTYPHNVYSIIQIARRQLGKKMVIMNQPY
jgi:hypothetical protein